MPRPVTLFTGQWADLPFEELCRCMGDLGYDGVELACWGDHFEISKADADYCARRWEILRSHGLTVFALANHLVGQAVCDRIDERHRAILPPQVWGDGDPEGVRQRAAQEMIRTGEAARRMGLGLVAGFTGSSIWHLAYSFPPVPSSMIDEGFRDFAARWKPILDAYQGMGIRFALEVHPTEIAFDIPTAERALEALDHHPAFGFNFDPSHFGYQNVDGMEFLQRFRDRIFNVHIKDARWASKPTPAGVFGGHLAFGDPRRAWDFCTPGRGNIDFESLIRTLNRIGYAGPLSVEWEDPGMDRFHGAKEALAFVWRLDFQPSGIAFDQAFSNPRS